MIGGSRAIVRILSGNRCFYLDDSNGAAVACRTLMSSLARAGAVVEALSGTMVDAGAGGDPASLLGDRRLPFRVEGGGCITADRRSVADDDPPRLTTTVDGVPLTIRWRPIRTNHEPDESEARELLRLFDRALDRFHPDILMTYGGDLLTRILISRARDRGVATIFTLHNFAYAEADRFADADAVVVPSQFSAAHYSRALDLACSVLPNVVDPARVVADDRNPTYVTFVNPSFEKGVYPFARIADELGRRRPDIPFLVVESRGSEATLASCGLDLRRHGNVFLRGPTPDPRRFWKVTSILLMPSLFRESQGLVAAEAMTNGIPVVASDRGALPETVGDAGTCLSLPDHLTPASRHLPTAEEVAPWVRAIIRLWDDPAFYEAQSRRASAESMRWSPGVLLPRYLDLFEKLRRS